MDALGKPGKVPSQHKDEQVSPGGMTLLRVAHLREAAEIHA